MSPGIVSKPVCQSSAAVRTSCSSSSRFPSPMWHAPTRATAGCGPTACRPRSSMANQSFRVWRTEVSSGTLDVYHDLVLPHTTRYTASTWFSSTSPTCGRGVELMDRMRWAARALRGAGKHSLCLMPRVRRPGLLAGLRGVVEEFYDPDSDGTTSESSG